MNPIAQLISCLAWITAMVSVIIAVDAYKRAEQFENRIHQMEAEHTRCISVRFDPGDFNEAK